MSDFLDYYGLALPKLNQGQVPIGVAMSIKFIDADGRTSYQEFKSPDIHAIEAIGMLKTMLDTLRHLAMNQATRPNDQA